MWRGRLIAAGGLALGLLAPASSQAELLDANCPGPPTTGGTGGGYSAQTFIAQHTGTIVRGEMTVQKGAGANFQLSIWNAVLNTGPVSPPLGTSAPISDTTIPNGVQTPVDGVFNPGVPVTAGTVYAIAIRRVDNSSYTTGDRSDRTCPGFEFGSNTGMGAWAFGLPQYDYMFQTFVEPSNDLTIKSQVGRTLTVGVLNAGSLSLAGAAVAVKSSAAISKKRKKKPQILIAPSQATAAGPGDVTLAIALTKAGKQRLKQKGKVVSGATVTFQPTGGQPKSVQTTIKIKGKRKHK
jgi:hypothetical protein